MRHEHMTAWTPSDDRIILALYKSEGRKWAKIAQALPGRTSASVRNRFLRIEKGEQMRLEGKTKNRCAACGQFKLGHVCPARGPAGAVTPSTANAERAAAMPVSIPIATAVRADDVTFRKVPEVLTAPVISPTHTHVVDPAHAPAVHLLDFAAQSHAARMASHALLDAPSPPSPTVVAVATVDSVIERPAPTLVDCGVQCEVGAEALE